MLVWNVEVVKLSGDSLYSLDGVWLGNDRVALRMESITLRYMGAVEVCSRTPAALVLCNTHDVE